MSYLPFPSPKESYCHRCGARLNHYGYCPNQAKHSEEDRLRHEDIENRKKQKEEALEALLDSAFGNKPIPFFSTPHTCVWETYGDDKHCCKVCGKIVFNKDYPKLFRKGDNNV